MVKAGVLILCMATLPPRLAQSVTGSDSEQQLIKEIAESGRCAGLSQPPDARVSPPPQMVVPGPPPLLSFRYYEEKRHHGFDNTDLMLDDAGH